MNENPEVYADCSDEEKYNPNHLEKGSWVPKDPV